MYPLRIVSHGLSSLQGRTRRALYCPRQNCHSGRSSKGNLKLTPRVITYLVNVVGEEQLSRLLNRKKPATVTYHDPCHLRKAQGVTEEPRKLPSLIPDVYCKEMKQPEACYGLGGTYCIAHMERSKSIQAKKIDDAQQPVQTALPQPAQAVSCYCVTVSGVALILQCAQNTS